MKDEESYIGQPYEYDNPKHRKDGVEYYLTNIDNQLALIKTLIGPTTYNRLEIETALNSAQIYLSSLRGSIYDA